MPNLPQIVLPHGGYRKLIVYRKADVIYEGTVAFCRRFLAAVRFVTQMLRMRRFGKMQSWRSRVPRLRHDCILPRFALFKYCERGEITCISFGIRRRR